MHSPALSNTTVLPDRQAREKEQLMQRIHDCLHHDTSGHLLSVEELARNLYMSRPTLYRKLKTMTGLTPNELINRYRLQQAAAMLAAGKANAAQVARMLGYNSQSSFGKSFLKQFHITPAAYQRRQVHLSINTLPI